MCVCVGTGGRSASGAGGLLGEGRWCTGLSDLGYVASPLGALVSLSVERWELMES